MLSASEEHASRWRGRGLPPWHPNFQHPTSRHADPHPRHPVLLCRAHSSSPGLKGPGAREGKSVRGAPDGGRQPQTPTGRPPSRLAAWRRAARYPRPSSPRSRGTAGQGPPRAAAATTLPRVSPGRILPRDPPGAAPRRRPLPPTRGEPPPQRRLVPAPATAPASDGGPWSPGRAGRRGEPTLGDSWPPKGGGGLSLIHI